MTRYGTSASGHAGLRRKLRMAAACFVASFCVLTTAAAAQVVINEIDYDQVGTDTAEFIELKNTGATPVNLDSFTIKLINGASGTEYGQSPIDLPNVNLAAGDYFVIADDVTAVANTDFVVAGNLTLQNGAPDAVQLLDGMTIVDTVSYEGTTAGFSEGTGASAADSDVTPYVGLSRAPDGADTDDNDTDFALRCITPGTANAATAAGCAAPLIVRATKTDSLLSVLGVSGDVDADGVADPGDTVSYTVEISAFGDAADVTLEDTVDVNSTLVPGSVRITPIAFDDLYELTGTMLTVPAATGVLANDIDPDHSTAPGTNTDLTAVDLDVTGTAGTVSNFLPDGSFDYETAMGFSGLDSFQYTARDEDTLDSVTTGVVVIDVQNTAPTATDDSYATLGNTLLEVTLDHAGVASTQNTMISQPSVIGETTTPKTYRSVFENDTDTESAKANLTAAVVGASVSAGAVVAMFDDGTFEYTPPVGFTGADTFDYTVTDEGGLEDTGTVTINVSSLIWFVDNTNAGTADGRSTTPYTTLAPIDAGGGDDGKDGTGDTIFVFAGTGNTSGGILLENNQILQGQEIALAPAGFEYAGGGALVASSTAPTIIDAAGDVIVLASGNTVRGLDIAATAGRAVFGNAIAGATFDQVGTAGTGTGTGVAFTGATGTITITDLDVNSSTGPGIDIQGGSAAFTFDASCSITSPSAAAFNVGGASTVAVAYPGNITQANAFPAVNIVDHSTGTLGFGGTISATNGTGLQFSNADGVYDITTMSGTTTLNGGDAGIDILGGSGGTFTFANITITNPSGIAFREDTSTAGVTYNGAISKAGAISAVSINAKTGGTTTFNGLVTANTGAATGINLTGNTGGTINFGGGLNIDTTTGTGFNATGGGTVNVTATGGDESINTTAGKALELDGITAGISFDSVSSTSSSNATTGQGIDIASTSGSVTMSGGAINHTGTATAFDVGDTGNMTGGTATITYAGSITNTAGRSILVQQRAGGTINLTGNIDEDGTGMRFANNNDGPNAINLSGASKSFNTAGNTAVDLVNNDTATISFTGGGLDIDTTSGIGFNATGGAVAINVTGTGNTVTSTTGTAVNIDSTTIGASGVTFRSVSANGATNGIVLNSTGTLGGLTITGDGGGTANGSGGTIQNTIEDGIRLANTRDVSISQLNITDAAQQADGTAGDDHAIDISSVTNFTYQDAVIDGFGNSVSHHDDQHSIAILNLFGTSLIEDVRFDNINEDGIEYINNTTDDGSRDVLTVRRGDFNDHLATNGESSIQAESQLTSNMGLTVDDCDFDVNGNGALGVLANSTGTSNFSITIQGSTFNAASAFGAGTIQIVNASDSTGTNVITGNDINDTPFNGILVNNDDNATSTATISNNTIDGSGVGVNNGFGIQVRQDENGSMTVLIDDNDIGDMDANQIRVQARDTTDGSGIINATVTDNTALNAPGDFIFGFELLKQDNNTACLDIRGNNFIGNDGGFPGFGDDIRLSQSGTAAMNVEQTSAANITALNNSDSVSVGGTANFSSANCPTP